LKNQYFFDNSQIAAPCGGPGGGAVGVIFGDSGTTLLGGPVPGNGVSFSL
jgi:hypothetical protein